MPTIKWDDKYSVNNSLIDAQHKDLFEKINFYTEACINTSGSLVIKSALAAFDEYTKKHFSFEENLLIKNNYPHLEEHLDKHAVFINEIKRAGETLCEKNVDCYTKLAQFLNNWLVEHILIEDQKYIEYIKNDAALKNDSSQMLNIKLKQTIDITKSQRDKFLEILSSISDGILVLSNNGKVEYANAAAEKLLEIPAISLIGQNSPLTFYKDNQYEDKKSFNGNKEKIFKINSQKMLNWGSSDDYYCLTFRDITSDMYFLDNIIHEKAKSDAAIKIKTDFINMVSHEIRTPLNGIVATADLLKNKNPEQNEYIKIIQKSGKNLTDLLNNILNLSQSESGNLEIINRHFNLHEIIKDVINLFKPLAANKGISLESNINQGVCKNLIGDPLKLKQILTNLINNSLKFTDTGYIKISINSKEKCEKHCRLQFNVEDSGIGMKEDKLKEIFKPFSQVHSYKDNEKYGGTGLGLAIVKRIIELMGGTISVKSIFGKGTEFSFDLLLEKDNSKKNKSDLDNIIKSSPLKNPVLIVDDNLINAKVTSKILNHFKAQTSSSYDGNSAIDLAVKNKYSLILLDCELPGASGFEVSSMIRNNSGPNKNTPIVAITGKTSKQDKEKCLSSGMNEVLSKPITMEKIKDLLSRLDLV